MSADQKETQALLVGIDVGSTTTKIAVTDESGALLYADYRRHEAAQLASIRDMLAAVSDRFPDTPLRLALTGSGGSEAAECMGVPYIQEVVANSIALKELYGQVGTAIELGGQDAKMIFFRTDEKTGSLQVSDMRMNGSCAGGTGAFIDEIATVLKTPVEEFDALAAKGSRVYDISGRCGVYAKTDIQPLLNQGASRADLALSAFHAIAKQTIGGLSQGLTIEKPVAFEGGPLTFNPTLVRVFAERLHLDEADILRPDRPEMMMAYGAALSLSSMFAARTSTHTVAECIGKLEEREQTHTDDTKDAARPFFKDQSAMDEFKKRHALPALEPHVPVPGETLRAYLGIDSGSTTTKFVLMGEDGTLLHAFYGPNEGEPLQVAKRALLSLADSYEKAGATLEIISAGATGYGELLFSKAWGTENHMVETVAHARAAGEYVDDATFLLDIGGQDMKAIWLDHGIVTNIVVNEACSSGCGSFLENFASSLHIPVDKIAEEAFASQNPAVLGSRCTVFMNSSIVTQQRNGRQAGDIMAGLCRSIIENVFTKVIRIANVDSLGERIVVQGGTFLNDAVLCALEQYLGREVVRAPYPGLMGAIGAALLTKEEYETAEMPARTFIGIEGLRRFSYTEEADAPCPFCANHCHRSILRFSTGGAFVTNNRCERGEIVGDPSDPAVREALRRGDEKRESVPDLFKVREELLMRRYPHPTPRKQRDITIGIPLVLSFWDTLPFWNTFWKTLGFPVVLSDKSTRQMYESGLYAVTSDTACFPAKLVHGHLRNLAEKKVDRIFFPSVTAVPSENREETSESMCALVKGYPIVVRNSDNPEERLQIPLDAPLFHWHAKEDRARQLSDYMKETFGIPADETRQAIRAGDKAQRAFRSKLQKAGKKVLDDVHKKGTYAVVLASRPYQNDGLVNHGLPSLFTQMGIPVLTADSLPGAEQVDLSASRLDIVNNFHARMLSTAVMAAKDDCLEYVQVVSFGCGHDAYLSDEIIRMMKEISGKAPLVLKVDESDIQGPLRIRVRSFLETVEMGRRRKQKRVVKKLADPYPAKFTKKDRQERVVLVPNTSHGFCRLLSAAMKGQGLRTEPLPVGREEAIRLGKRYVHNDICFPAQIVIGEALAALESGAYDPDHVAIGMAKYIGDCRLTHYSALLRKALDDAGYPQVPILTNDDVDSHRLHPGYKMNIRSALHIAFVLPMLDVLEELLRKIRPYERNAGDADRAFEAALDDLIYGLEERGLFGAKKGFAQGIERMRNVPYDRSHTKPRVLIVGEYLLNFHPGANHEIERYLEANGMEVVEARMTDVIRKTYFYQDAQNKEYRLHRSPAKKAWPAIANRAFEWAHDLTDHVAKQHPLYEKACRLPELVEQSDPIIHHTFDAGEGVLIPGEILHHARKGCRNFVILQPFGCLPNHVVGRGISARLKELYPDAQILPLDYDPDVSFANIENRLQMLIMNAQGDAPAETQAQTAKERRHEKRNRKLVPAYRM